MYKRAVFTAVLVLAPFLAHNAVSSPSFLVEPYLQSPGSDRMTVMWETDDLDNGTEYWKEGESPVTVPAEQVPGRNIYFANLEGLDSNTLYNYRVLTSGGTSPVYRFKTWPTSTDGVDAFKMVVFSDSQGNWPDRLEDICENGIIDKECTDGFPENCPEDIAAILIAGDLVSNGEEVYEWRNEFFGPCRNAFHYIPILPAIGNHDDPLQNYLDYFTLPDNGEPLAPEQWYTVDYLNLRLITLNSARFAPLQLSWFEDLLAATRTEEQIDYVVTQFHHGCQSEVWPPGENIQSCLFVSWLEQLTAESGKPSAHLFGHTHAYSRGQSRDVPHFWVNVGTSAGDIDYWGEYDQKDYDRFQMSYDEYGFSVLHFTTGDHPSFRMVRRTGGDDENYYGYTDETVRDDFSVTSPNTLPARPQAVYPKDVQVEDKTITLEASPFLDADGDLHLSSHWQVTTTPGDYTTPVVDAWGNETRFQNIWGDEDTQAGTDITTHTVNLAYNMDYSWRVRYRDEHFAWSDWSEEASFSTGAAPSWEPASISGVGASPGSSLLNGLILLLAPLGAVLFWKRWGRRKREVSIRYSP